LSINKNYNYSIITLVPFWVFHGTYNFPSAPSETGWTA
jgi:hypothetical protein